MVEGFGSLGFGVARAVRPYGQEVYSFKGPKN